MTRHVETTLTRKKAKGSARKNCTGMRLSISPKVNQYQCRITRVPTYIIIIAPDQNKAIKGYPGYTVPIRHPIPKSRTFWHFTYFNMLHLINAEKLIYLHKSVHRRDTLVAVSAIN